MRFLFVVVTAAGFAVAPLAAQSVTLFKRACLVDSMGKTTEVNLVLDAERGTIAAALADSRRLGDLKARRPTGLPAPYDIIISIAYSAIESISYYAGKKRGAGQLIASGGIINAARLPFSKRPHWLYIIYQDGEQDKEFAVQLDKANYKDILTALASQAGTSINNIEYAKIKAKD